MEQDLLEQPQRFQASLLIGPQPTCNCSRGRDEAISPALFFPSCHRTAPAYPPFPYCSVPLVFSSTSYLLSVTMYCCFASFAFHIRSPPSVYFLFVRFVLLSSSELWYTTLSASFPFFYPPPLRFPEAASSRLNGRH